MLMFNDEKKEPHEYFSNLKRVLGRWNIRGDDYTGTFLQPTQDTLIVTYRGLKVSILTQRNKANGCQYKYLVLNIYLFSRRLPIVFEKQCSSKVVEN